MLEFDFLSFLKGFFTGIIGISGLYFCFHKSQNVEIADVTRKKSNDFSDLHVVYVVNADLKMGPGKIISQVCHAAVDLKTKCDKRKYLEKSLYFEDNDNLSCLVYKGTGEQLKEMNNISQSLGLPYTYIIDAGRTQIASGSNTVVAVGPIEKTYIMEMVTRLKLIPY